MQEFIDNFIKYGYIFLFLYSLGGGMMVLLALGIFSSAYNINPYISIFVAFIGNFLGSSVLFYLTKISKKDVDKYFKNHRRKLALLVILFRKNGFVFTLICKFIYGLKTLGPIAAQMSKLSFIKFSIYNVISCFVWAVLVFYIAVFLGENLQIMLEQYKSYGIAALVLIVISIFMYFKIKTKK